MTNRKYELTDITMNFTYDDVEYKLHRIRSLVDIDFAKVKKGDLGGWVGSEDNLNPSGDSWIHDESKCFSHAIVTDDSQMYDHSIALGHTMIEGESVLRDKVIIHDGTNVYDETYTGSTYIRCGKKSVDEYKIELVSLINV